MEWSEGTSSCHYVIRVCRCGSPVEHNRTVVCVCVRMCTVGCCKSKMAISLPPPAPPPFDSAVLFEYFAFLQKSQQLRTPAPTTVVPTTCSARRQRQWCRPVCGPLLYSHLCAPNRSCPYTLLPHGAGRMLVGPTRRATTSSRLADKTMYDMHDNTQIARRDRCQTTRRI